MNTPRFFENIKLDLFNNRLLPTQTQGIQAILDEWEKRQLSDIRWLSYILATTHHETAKTFQPINEFGLGKGKPYGLPDIDTGKCYYGRGFVQLTWKSNYKKLGNILKIDLVNNPELALDLKISTQILFEGMIKGLFTNKRLSDFFNNKKEDWINARKIVNGLDRAEKIADYAKTFYAYLL